MILQPILLVTLTELRVQEFGHDGDFHRAVVQISHRSLHVERITQSLEEAETSGGGRLDILEVLGRKDPVVVPKYFRNEGLPLLVVLVVSFLPILVHRPAGWRFAGEQSPESRFSHSWHRRESVVQPAGENQGQQAANSGRRHQDGGAEIRKLHRGPRNSTKAGSASEV